MKKLLIGTAFSTVIMSGFLMTEGAASEKLEKRIRENKDQSAKIEQTVDADYVDLGGLLSQYESAQKNFRVTWAVGRAAQAEVDKTQQAYVLAFIDGINSGKSIKFDGMSDADIKIIKDLTKDIEIKRLALSRSQENKAKMESNLARIKADLERNKEKLEKQDQEMMDIVTNVPAVQNDEEQEKELASNEADIVELTKKIEKKEGEVRNLKAQIEKSKAMGKIGKPLAAKANDDIIQANAGIAVCAEKRNEIRAKIEQIKDAIASRHELEANLANADMAETLAKLMKERNKTHGYIVQGENGLPKLEKAIAAKMTETIALQAAIDKDVQVLKDKQFDVASSSMLGEEKSLALKAAQKKGIELLNSGKKGGAHADEAAVSKDGLEDVFTEPLLSRPSSVSSFDERDVSAQDTDADSDTDSSPPTPASSRASSPVNLLDHHAMRPIQKKAPTRPSVSADQDLTSAAVS
ncbi:MAG: hypothetical protein NTX76_00595 [Alphaproteobacteria bacterium]|nr:hypothetical protein [Alphaproteobacteria bacterium]